MPLLLANFIYSRDCKLNLRKNVDTTWHLHVVCCNVSIFFSFMPKDLLVLLLQLTDRNFILPEGLFHYIIFYIPRFCLGLSLRLS